MAYIKKLTVKSVCGDAKALAKGATEPRAIARFIGIATGMKEGVTDFGGRPSPWVKFLGQFKGINLITGEEFRGSACLLPEVASDPLASALKDPSGSPVEFAVDILIREAENPIGYEYLCNPVIEPDQSDPLEQLSARLPAPKMEGLPLESDKAEQAPRKAVSGRK